MGTTGPLRFYAPPSHVVPLWTFWRYGRLHAFSGPALWTKNRYGHLGLFPDVRYGRFDFMAESIQSLWTKNIMADPENQDSAKTVCAMDVSTLRTAAVRSA